MKKQELGLIIRIEEKKPTQEEQLRDMAKLFVLILESYKSLLENNDKTLTKEERKQIKKSLVCLPYLKELTLINNKNDII